MGLSKEMAALFIIKISWRIRMERLKKRRFGYMFFCIVLFVMAVFRAEFSNLVSAKGAEKDSAGVALKAVVGRRRQGTSDSGRQKTSWIDWKGNTVAIPARTSGKENLVSAFSFSPVQSRIFPESYDPRKLTETASYLSAVRNQGAYGTCWAVAGITAAETGILKNKAVRQEWQSENGQLLSAAHLAWYLYAQPAQIISGAGIHGDYLDLAYKGADGGDYTGVIAALAAGEGSQLEKNSPYENWNYGQSEEARYVSYYSLDNAKVLTDAATRAAQDTVKAWICSGGAVEAGLYFAAQKDETCYYQETYSAAYANHEVVLMGWDDDYAKENFERNGVKPKHNGAWLARNSYGEEWGDGGYFYISYEEPSLNGFICYEMTERTDGEKCYQYDGAGGWIGVASSWLGAAANVFTAEKNGMLTSVGITLAELNASGCDYNIRVYRWSPLAFTAKSMVNTGDIVKKQKASDFFTEEYLAAETEGAIEYSGYQKVSLPEPVPLKARDQYAVVLTLSARDGHSAIYYSFEGSIQGYALGKYHYNRNEGETYYLEGTGKDAEWKDTIRLTEQKDGFALGNLAVKAFVYEEETEKNACRTALAETVENAGEFLHSETAGQANTELLAFLEQELAFAERALAGDVSAWELENARASLQAAMEYMQYPAKLSIRTPDELYSLSKQTQSLSMNALQVVSIEKNLEMNPSKYFSFGRFDTEQDKKDKGVIQKVKSKRVQVFAPIGGRGGIEFLIEGNGHSISGLVASAKASDSEGQEAFAGLIGLLSGNGEIRNLVIKDSYIEGNQCVGSFCGALAYGGKVDHCTVKNTFVYGYEMFALSTWNQLYPVNIGGIAGLVTREPSQISNSKVKECFVYGGLASGGIAGMVNEGGSADVKNSVYNSSVVGIAGSSAAASDDRRIGVGICLGGEISSESVSASSIVNNQKNYIFKNQKTGEENYLLVNLYKPKTSKNNNQLLLFVEPYDKQGQALIGISLQGDMKKKKRGKSYMEDGFLIKKIASDISLLPKTGKKYTLEFYHPLTEKALSTQLVLQGKKAQRVKAPKLKGYTFTGWYDVYTGKKFTFDMKIRDSYVLYPQYKKKK